MRLTGAQIVWEMLQREGVEVVVARVTHIDHPDRTITGVTLDDGPRLQASWYVDADQNGVPDIYEFGKNRIHFSTFTARGVDGTKIALTEQEIKLLKLFIKKRGKPLSRKSLLEAGWGYSLLISTRTVDNFIVRFRKYFEAHPKTPVYFKSLRSVGYVFDPKGGEKNKEDSICES